MKKTCSPLACFLVLLAAICGDAPAEDRIPLRVDWPGAEGGVSFPTYCGLSLPKGAVASADQVQVVDGGGKAVAAGVEALAKWTPDVSLKWVGLHFLAKKGADYFAVIGAAAKRPAGIVIRETAEAIVLDTGAAKFELPKVGALLGKVEVGVQVGVQALACPGGAACLLVQDQQHRVADETHGDASEAPKVEVDGGVFAVVRREGFFKTAGGERLGKYVVRLEFTAGSATVKMQHSFINTESSHTLQYADISIRLPLAGAAPWDATFEPAPGAAPVSAKLDPAAGDAAYLLQADYPHHGQKTNRREIKLRRGSADFADFSKDPNAAKAAGNWAAVQTPSGGAMIALPKLAQLFPKELEVSKDGLTAHLWSSRGGRLLDYRTPALIEHWGLAWVDKQYPGGSAAMGKIETDAQGSARTHDVWLHFFAPKNAASLAAVGRLCAAPPLCIQDPQWMRRTEAMGFIHPYDPEHFPEMEKFLTHFMTEYLVGQEKRWGDYGFLDFGCGPHYYDSDKTLPGETMPRLSRRYAGFMYHGQTALWQAYARSGERMYRDYTEAFHRHNADYYFVHAPGPRKPMGAHSAGGVSEEDPFYWAGLITIPSGVVNGHQGRDIGGFLLQHYLTGDRWGLETVLRFGEVFLRDFKPSVLPNIGVNSDGAQPLLTAAPLYLHTGDPRYLKMLEAVRAIMVDPRTRTGWVDSDYYGAWEKYHIKIAGTLADYLASGSPIARAALEKAFPIWLWRLPERTTGYQDEDGLFCNYAWRLTGNIRYAEFMEERFHRALFEYMDGDGNVRGPSHGGPHQGANHGFNFFETAFFGMDLLAETEGRRAPYVALDAGVAAHPVEMWFSKEWHQPVDLELRASAQPDLQVRWTPEEPNRPHRDYHGTPVRWDFYPSYYSKDAPGLAGGYVHAEVGVETVAGEYRLLNVPLVFKHNAKQFVMVARDGLVLRATSSAPPTWFFQVPAGKSGAIFTNKPIVVKLGGKPIATRPGEWTELQGGASDEMASLTTSGIAFVNFRGGIPPVLAQHEASLFFVPREVQEEMPEREAVAKPIVTHGDFAPGLSGHPADQAFNLTGKHTLKIPRGKLLREGRYEFIDYREGTLEFWFQPRWSTGSSVATSHLTFLTGGFWPCFVRHYSGDDDEPVNGSYIQLTAPSSQKPAQGGTARTAHSGMYPEQDLRNSTPVSAGAWHHFAVSWTTDEKRGWLSEIYLDGKPALPWTRFDTGLGRFLETQKDKFVPPKPWPIDEPKGDLITLLGSALDANVDELRISKTARYPKPFPMLPKRKLERDDDTLLLMRFDGNETAEK